MASVLYVEDQKLLRESLGKLLEFLGHKVKLAEDGEQGYAVFQQNKDNLDLVITDLNMPKLDGLGFAKKIKENYPEIKIPIIALTGYAPQESIDYEQIGIKKFYEKPIGIGDLEKVITEHATI